jgi:two-component system chemotaxis sensor kinase CheA
MPGMSGFDFVAATLADEALRHVPAVLVTSRNSPEDLARGRAVGARDHIVKGEFDQTAFLRRVDELSRQGA